MTKFKILTTIAIAIMSCSVAFAQNSDLRKKRETQDKRTDRAKAQMLAGDLFWETLDTHLTVDISITGKDVNWQKRFTKGNQPEFNAFHEGLEPGIYHYQVTFTANKVVEEQDKLQDLTDRRKSFMQQYEQAVEAGDEAKVKRLYWKANQLRLDRKKIQTERASRRFKPNDDFIRQQGNFVVDENRMVSRYDRARESEKHREEMREQRRLDPPAREEEEPDGFKN